MSLCGNHDLIRTFLGMSTGNVFGSASNFHRKLYCGIRENASKMDFCFSAPSFSLFTFVPKENRTDPFFDELMNSTSSFQRKWTCIKKNEDTLRYSEVLLSAMVLEENGFEDLPLEY